MHIMCHPILFDSLRFVSTCFANANAPQVSTTTSNIQQCNQARRKTLQQYHKMQTKLVTCNLELMGGIQESENDVHDKVTALLEQYEKFRVGHSTVTHVH